MGRHVLGRIPLPVSSSSNLAHTPPHRSKSLRSRGGAHHGKHADAAVLQLRLPVPGQREDLGEAQRVEADVAHELTDWAQRFPAGEERQRLRHEGRSRGGILGRFLRLLLYSRLTLRHAHIHLPHHNLGARERRSAIETRDNRARRSQKGQAVNLQGNTGV